MSHTSNSLRVVALIGFSRPAPARTRYLLQHCGFVVIEVPRHVDDVRSLMHKVHVDAVVLDARPIPPSEEPQHSFVPIMSCVTARSEDQVPVAVIVLANGRVPPWVRQTCQQYDAHFRSTASARINYPDLARVLRDLCGLESDCCTPFGASTRSHRSDSHLGQT